MRPNLLQEWTLLIVPDAFYVYEYNGNTDEPREPATLTKTW